MRKRLRQLRERRRALTRQIKRLARQVALAAKLKRHGVRRPFLVIAEARRTKLGLVHALTVMEKETGIPQRNVFGCDHGPQGGRPPYCGEAVTRARVRAYWPTRRTRMNGIGWTQLTWWSYVERAERLGGVHKPKYQMRVGFRLLASLMKEHGVREGYRRFNGSGPAAEAYASDCMNRLLPKWRRRLS